MTTIIIGAGVSGLQMGYYFQKYKIDYVILEQNSICGLKFLCNPYYYELEYPIYEEFDLLNDYYSLLCDDIKEYNFCNYRKKTYNTKYPKGCEYWNYLNDFYKINNLNIHFETKVKNINYCDDIYYIETNKKIYKGIKIILATGYNKKITNNINIITNNRKSIKHFVDYEYDLFYNEIELIKFKNKKILIIGFNNYSIKLLKKLDYYTKNIIILESNNNKSYYEHLKDIELNKLLNNYKNLIYFDDFNYISIIKNILDEKDINYDKYFITKNNNFCNFFNCDFFDTIILCTEFKFNKKIFNKNLNIKFDSDDIPFLNNYSIINNNDFLLIGSLMFKNNNKIYNYRFIIEKIFYNHFFCVKKFIYFDIESNLNEFYDKFKNFIDERTKSPELLTTNGILNDLFYFDSDSKTIKYKKNFIIDNKVFINKIINLNINTDFIFFLRMSVKENMSDNNFIIEIYKKNINYFYFYDFVLIKSISSLNSFNNIINSLKFLENYLFSLI